jgi:hypothetical protein
LPWPRKEGELDVKWNSVPDEKPSDAVEKLLKEQQSLDDREQALIADLLKQRESALKDFDEKLEKLGYLENSSGRPRRSHHKKGAVPTGEAAAKPKVKT